METMSVISKVSFLPGRFVAWTTRTKIGCCVELIGVGVVGWILSLTRNSFIHEKDNNFIEHQIRLCQDHQSTMTQRKGRSEMTKGKINSLNCEWVWLFSFHVDWFRKKSLEVSLYTIDEKILSIGGWSSIKRVAE